MPDRHRARVGQQLIELGGNFPGASATEARTGLEDIDERPAGDHAVVGRDQVADEHAHVADHRPGGRPTRLHGNPTHCDRRTTVATAADQQFGNQYRNRDDHDAKQVHQDERAAAAHARDVREFPDIAETDGSTDGGEYEGQAGGPGSVCDHCASLSPVGAGLLFAMECAMTGAGLELTPR